MNEIEGALGTADGETTSDLSARLLTALKWAAAWQKAGYKAATLNRINAMITALHTMRDQVERLAPFLNAQGVRDYNSLSMKWAQLYRDVALSTDLFPTGPADVADVIAAIAKAAAAASDAAKTGAQYVIAILGLYALSKVL